MSQVISPVTGTRIEPKDSYVFMRGTTATFKTIVTVNDRATTFDYNTVPTAQILAPPFLNTFQGVPLPVVITTLYGSLVPGQEFEYQFVWNIPGSSIPLDDYIVSYTGFINGLLTNVGDEYFTISATLGVVGLRVTGFCTVDDIRKKKFNIDDYLPKAIANDLEKRNQLIQEHIYDATNRLREELNLAKMRSNSANYRLFCIYYTIWSLLLGSRGEDGSSVSDQNILYWRTEYERILAQEKRESVMQGIPIGRG